MGIDEERRIQIQRRIRDLNERLEKLEIERAEIILSLANLKGLR